MADLENRRACKLVLLFGAPVLRALQLWRRQEGVHTISTRPSGVVHCPAWCPERLSGRRHLIIFGRYSTSSFDRALTRTCMCCMPCAVHCTGCHSIDKSFMSGHLCLREPHSRATVVTKNGSCTKSSNARRSTSRPFVSGIGTPPRVRSSRKVHVGVECACRPVIQ